MVGAHVPWHETGRPLATTCTACGSLATNGKSGLSALVRVLQSGERGRRVVLGVAMRHWALVAHEMTLALMWTGTSLHKALLMLLKKEVGRAVTLGRPTHERRGLTGGNRA